MTALILIAEDHAEIAEVLSAYLEQDGYRTVRAANGQVALDLHLALKPDIVLLDVKMPLVDGWQVLAEIRRRGTTPVLMITALDQDLDKLQALRIGADDYVVKPFNPAEVVARVKAVLRRATGLDPQSVIRVGSLEIDLQSHAISIRKDDKSTLLNVTLTEFRLLTHLARNPTRVFSRSELVDACLPGSDALERTVDSHLSKLRRKLDEAGVTDLVTNVRGVGYRLVGPQ